MKIVIHIFSFLLFIFGLHAQDKKIETDLVYKMSSPLKKSNKVPVLILLHGYGSNESDLFDIAKSQDERFMTFSLRGPYNANSTDGFAWFSIDRDEKNELISNYKEASISRKKIMSFISHACRDFKLDSTQVIVMGFSQGAMMCFDIAFSEPGKVKALIPLSGKVMKESKEKKIKDSDLLNIGFFIGHGTEDNIIDVKFADEASAYLTHKKARFTLKKYSMPHSICGSELNDIKYFITKQLRQEK